MSFGFSSIVKYYSKQNRFVPCFSGFQPSINTQEQLISHSTHPAKLPSSWKVMPVVMIVNLVCHIIVGTVLIARI